MPTNQQLSRLSNSASTVDINSLLLLKIRQSLTSNSLKPCKTSKQTAPLRGGSV